MKIVFLASVAVGLSLSAFSNGPPAAEPSLWPEFPALRNGDANADGELDLSDAVYLLSWLYHGAAEPAPLACPTEYSALGTADVNGDGERDLSDPVAILGFIFSGGPAPADPCGLGTAAAAGGAACSSRILPAHAHAFGKSLGEWTAAWWQWALAMPVDAHPLFDTADCDAGQSGKVFFLGGAFTGTSTTRECTVPVGKAILIAVLNVECSTVEPPPFFGSNEEELRECAKGFQDTGFGLSASVDDCPVQNLDGYRVQSPVFDFSAPANNVLFIPGPVSGQSVSDGVWLLIAPLSAGEHVIHVQGSFPGFPIDVTYNLTVS
jgi:hypothetical protein